MLLKTIFFSILDVNSLNKRFGVQSLLTPKTDRCLGIIIKNYHQMVEF